MNKDTMSISAFARRSLLSVKALRLYDEMGILRPERVDASSRYRYYSESQLETARLISLLRKLDVPLATIAEIITLEPAGASAALAEWWQIEMADMLGRGDLLHYIRGSVLGDASVNDSSPEKYTINLRRVPEQTYLYRTRHLHGPELPTFITETTAYLFSRADHYGGPPGQISVMFHGQVDLDSDGPVDVCLPITIDAVVKGDDLIRTELAHAQAYTVVRKHQLEFPQILQVYQWMRRWIDENDFEISGLPREIYISDDNAAESDDLVCEIAYPIQGMKGTTP